MLILRFVLTLICFGITMFVVLALGYRGLELLGIGDPPRGLLGALIWGGIVAGIFHVMFLWRQKP